MALSDSISPPPFKHLRVIPYHSYPGHINMAVDYYLTQSCLKSGIPILRFYGWIPHCLSIGYHQNTNFVNHTALKKAAIGLVRRPTGGRAILHADELTYSIAVPLKIIDHKELYNWVHVLLATTLNHLGYPVNLKHDDEKLGNLGHKATDFACFTRSAQTEIQYMGKKVVGSAQKIYRDTILQHGSILIGNGHEAIINYLRLDPDTRHTITADFASHTACLQMINSQPISPLKLMRNTLKELDKAGQIFVNLQDISEQELQDAEKYSPVFSKI